MPDPTYLDYCSFMVNQVVLGPLTLFFSKIVLSILGHLLFHINSSKKGCRDFDWDCIENINLFGGHFNNVKLIDL